ncbi:MAG: hypothetical protein RR247_04380, partial [Clostridia bacterium]
MNITPKEIVVNFGSLSKYFKLGVAYVQTITQSTTILKHDGTTNAITVDGMVLGHGISVVLTTIDNTSHGDKSEVGMYVLSGYNSAHHAGVIKSVSTITGTTANNYSIVLNGTMEIVSMPVQNVLYSGWESTYSGQPQILKLPSLKDTTGISKRLSNLQKSVQNKAVADFAVTMENSVYEFYLPNTTAITVDLTKDGISITEAISVGMYKITVTLSDPGKTYSPSSYQATLLVKPREILLTSLSWNKVYDGTTTFNSKVECMPQGENIVAVETELKSMQINGTYASAFVNTGIAITFAFDKNIAEISKNNYQIIGAYVGNITAKQVTLTATNWSKYYDGADISIPV